MGYLAGEVQVLGVGWLDGGVAVVVVSHPVPRVLGCVRALGGGWWVGCTRTREITPVRVQSVPTVLGYEP